MIPTLVEYGTFELWMQPAAQTVASLRPVSLRLKSSCPGEVARASCGLESSSHYLFMCLHADVEPRGETRLLAAQRASNEATLSHFLFPPSFGDRLTSRFWGSFLKSASLSFYHLSRSGSHQVTPPPLRDPPVVAEQPLPELLGGWVGGLLSAEHLAH